jgi:inhibitor of KinA
MKIEALGDSALIIDLADEISDSSSLLPRVLSAAEAIEKAKLPGVVDVTSSYESVAVFFDLRQVEPDIEDKVRVLIASAGGRVSGRKRRLEIPVCYDEEFALDIERVANHTSLTPDAIVAFHSSAEYTVACIGFMPGFPFLAGCHCQCSSWDLSTGFAGRLECFGSHSAALISSERKSADVLAARRPDTFSRNYP